MSRSCARPGCARAAAATLSYAYSDGVVVLEPLADEAHPMVHDLCAQHAATVKVPRGWVLEDQWSSSHDRPEPGRGHLDLVGA